MKKALVLMLTLMMGFMALPVSAQVTLPYSQNFETNPAAITDFTLQAYNSNQWIIGQAAFMPDSAGAETGHSLYISNDSSSYAATYEDFETFGDFYAFAVLEVQFPSDAVEWRLSFDYKVPCGGSSQAFMSVYLVDDTYVPLEETPQGLDLTGELGNVAGWTHASYVLPNVAGSAKKIVFYWYNSYYAFYYASGEPAAIDNISITYSSCAQPADLTVTNVTSSSASVHWQENAAATSWKVYYRPVGNDTWTSVTATADSLELNNLAGNTAYECYVAAICSDGESTPTPTLTFHTGCTTDGITALPFMEDFEGEPYDGFLPCWTRSTSDPTGTHVAYQNIGDVWAWGSRVLDFGYTPDCYTQAILPMFGASIPLSTLKVDFDARRGNNDGAFLFGAMTDPTDDATFVVIDTIVTVCNGSYNECGWEHVTIYCNNYTGNGHYLAFRAEYCGNSPRLIDNLVIDVLPTCMPVSDLTVSNETLNGATVSWSGTADAYKVYVGDSVYATMDTFFVLSGLAPSSNYTVQVRSFCADDSSSLSAPLSFNTSCAAFTVTADSPWFEDFEGYAGGGEQPFLCWSTPVHPNGPFVYCGHSPSCHSGANSAELKGAVNMLVLPEFTNNLSDLRLSFWATATSVTLGAVEVGYMTDVTDTSTFVFVADAGTPGPRGYDNASGNGNYMGEFSFNSVPAATTARIALRYTNTDASASWNLDDFTVSLVPDCPSPVKTSVTASNVDGHNATITFADLDDAHDSWTVYYRVLDTSVDAPWTPFVTSTTTANLTGLAPETEYEVYVVTNCTPAPAVEDATLTISFTTAAACPAPENVTVSNISMTGATVTWSSNAGSFIVEYGEAGFTPGTGISAVVNADTCNLTGLTAGTNYTVYVTADCGVDSLSLVSSVDFHTDLCAPSSQCAYTFTLTDAFGDGWNTGSLTVKQNGIPVATLELLDGHSLVETVLLCDGIPTSFEWTNGYFDQESGFSVVGPGSVEIYSINDLSNYTTYSFTTNCTPPTCFRPTSVTVDSVGVNFAVVSWVPSGSETAWNVEYKANGEATWTVAHVTATTHTLTNLMADTYYDVRVQADCGDNDLSDYKTASFVTECDAVSTFPYNEGFENGLGCWSQETLTGSNPWTIYPYSANTGTNSIQMFYTANSSSRLTSPVFDLTGLSNPKVSFYYSMPDYQGTVDTFAVFYRTSAADAWVRIAGYNQTTLAFEIDSLVLPNPSATYQISFVGYGIDGNCIYLDDIQVYEGPAIVVVDPTVATLSASAIEQTTATLNGVVTNPDNVAISAKGFEWMPLMGDDYTQVLVTTAGDSLSYDLSNLTPATDYIFKAFITYNGTTVYGNELIFTTLEIPIEPCETPENLHAAAFGSNYITIGWNANPNASGWNVRYRPQGGSWTYVVANNNSYNFVGLTPETTYEFEVQADCGDDNLSDWCTAITVMTTVGIESWLENSVTLYPNPAKEVVNVQCTMHNAQSGGELHLLDVYGKLLQIVPVASETTAINVSGLAAGIYFVRVTTEAGTVTKSFVKQ